VFGQVVEGREIVDQLRSVATTSRAGHQDVPAEDIVINRAELVEG
jgi:peptidyl-prolyl cis-trans isomerase B (cyclophilin B)